MRSSGPHSFQTRENSYKTMKNVKRQNVENLKTYISYNNLFELIEVMEHGSFQGKHKFHNFNKFTYICHNCYNCHNLLITSASTKAQGSWARYFQQEKVFHIKCQLEDTTLKPPHRWEERIPDLVASCLEQWKIVCGQLWKQSMLAVIRGEAMHVLFHCFGGINRSAGVLCAWLVVGYNYSAEDAVQLLLEKRPSLRPWHNRPYVLEALWKLEGLRTEWHMEFTAADGN